MPFDINLDVCGSSPPASHSIDRDSWGLRQFTPRPTSSHLEVTLRKHARAQEANGAVPVTHRGLDNPNTVRASVQGGLSGNHSGRNRRGIHGDCLPSKVGCGQAEHAEVCANIEEEHCIGAMGKKTSELLPLLRVIDLRLIKDFISSGMANN